MRERERGREPSANPIGHLYVPADVEDIEDINSVKDSVNTQQRTNPLQQHRRCSLQCCVAAVAAIAVMPLLGMFSAYSIDRFNTGSEWRGVKYYLDFFQKKFIVMRCAGFAWTTYSQWGEDVELLNHYFCGLHGGTYVELGAHDGLAMSNTKFYEDHLGWSGVLIEPSPLFARLLRNRPKPTSKLFNGGVCSDEQHTFKCDRCYSTAEGEEYRPCKSLGSIFKQAGLSRVTFLSLDVEGGELFVLKTMDWNVPVCVWLVEMIFKEETGRAATQLLLDNGYKHVHHMLGGNELFVHNRLSDCLRNTSEDHGMSNEIPF